jgi:PAS domain S-box-containing protein
LHIEYLDTRRHQGQEYLADYGRFLSKKYEGRHLDLAIVADDAAFQFMVQIRPSFKASLPIVFCGVNNFTSESTQDIDAISGVNEAVDISGTVNLALELFPKASHLFAVAGSSGVGAINLQDFRLSIPTFSREIEIHELIDVQSVGLEETLSGIPSDSIILRLDNLREPDGSNTPIQQSITLLSSKASCPVFSLWDFDIGNGAIGGVVVSGIEQGRKAGELALRLLHGATAVPVVMESPDIPMFDYVQMQRFGVEVAALPTEALVLNIPSTYFERHQTLFWGGASLLALMAVWIAMLHKTLLGKRRAERSLLLKDKAVSGALNAIALADLKGKLTYVNRACIHLWGYTTDSEVLGRSALEFWKEPEKAADVINALFAHGAYQGEMVALKADGSHAQLLISASLIVDEAGLPLNLVASFVDITKLKEAEASLAKYAENQRILLDNIHTQIWYLTDVHTYGAVNKSHAEFNGTDVESMSFKSMYEIFPREVVDVCRQGNMEVFSTGKTLHSEEWVPHFSSELRLISIRKSPKLRDDGTVEYVVCSAEDITEQRQTEERLKESEERFKALHNASFGGIAIHDKGVILECNQGLSTMTGYEVEELIGMDGLLLIAEQSRSLVMQNILAGHEKPYEAFGVRKNGEEYPLRLEARNIPYKGKNVRVVEFRDITERKRDQDALRRSEERFRLAMEAATDGLWDWNTQTGVVYWSPRAFTMLGYEPDEFPVSFEVWRDMIHPEDRERTAAEVMQSIEHEGFTFNVEFRMRNKHGDWQWILGRGRLAQRDAQGKILRVLGTHVDITHRKQTEEMLRRSESKYRRLIDNLPDIVYIYSDLQGGVFWSPSVEAVLGWSVEFMYANPFQWNESIHPEDREAVSQAVIDATRGTGFSVEYRVHDKTDRWHWFHDRSISITVHEGETLVEGLATDITARKHADEQIRESNRRIWSILEKMPGGIFVHDSQGRITLANEMACTMTGYSRQELLHMTVGDLDPSAPLLPDVVDFWKGRGLVDARVLESVHIRKDGTLYIAEVHICAIDLSSQPMTLAVVFDITQRKDDEEAITAANARLEALWSVSSLEDADIKSVSDHVLASLTRMTGSAYGFYGFIDEKESTMSIHSWSGEAMRDCFMVDKPVHFAIADAGVWAEAVRKRAPLILNDFEEDHPAKKGLPEGHVSLTNLLVVPFFSHDKITAIAAVANRRTDYGKDDVDQITAFLKSIQAIVESKRAEEALLEAKVAAEAASRTKSEFLANMSHELRTPLSGVQGMLSLIKLTALDKEQEEYADMAIQSCHRLTRLLSDILDLSRVEAGRLPILSESFSLRDALNAVELLFRPLSQKAGVELSVRIDPTIPDLLQGDSVRLQQVINNFVGNAFKFTSAGSVSVTLHHLPSKYSGQYRVLFSVADTGCGIPDQKLGELFSPFTQVSEGLCRSHQGAGLGLSICKTQLQKVLNAKQQ